MAEDDFGGLADDKTNGAEASASLPLCSSVNDWRRAVEPRSAVVKMGHPLLEMSVWA